MGCKFILMFRIQKYMFQLLGLIFFQTSFAKVKELKSICTQQIKSVISCKKRCLMHK